MARRRVAGFALGALAVGVVAAATLLGSTRHVRLNLGPGDTPFVRGFERDSEVENKVGWHWTSYDATIDLPFETTGSRVEATLRYARVFGEEAVVDVSVSGVATERFRARGGEIRRDVLRAAGVRGPLQLRIRADSHERRNLGLKLDTLDLDAVSGAPFKLGWAAALRPPLAAALLFGGLLTLGLSPLWAGAWTFVASLAFAQHASGDLFGAWRQTMAVPAITILSTLLLFLARRFLERKAGVERGAATLLCAGALVTTLFRLALISHPDFYYPDLLTHTRVVQAIRSEGPSFFLHPADALNDQGAWKKPVLGSVSSLPYAVMFHAPFAGLAWALEFSTDQIETALKCGSAFISALPILLAGALAVRFALPPLSALMLCVIPTYVSRLSFALLPALFGHVFDLAVLLAIANVTSRDEMKPRRSILWTMGVLFLGHLAYTSSVVNEGLFVSVLAALCLPASSDRALGGRLVLAEAGAALAAFALYYRHFGGDVFGLALRLLGLQGGTGSLGSVYPVESFWGVLLERTSAFFGWPYIGLALLGLGFAGSATLHSRIVRAWGISYVVLIFLRAKIPDVFRYGHETLFLTPLVATLAGAALILAFRRGGWWRRGALTAGFVLGLVSFWRQWGAISDQLANAL